MVLPLCSDTIIKPGQVAAEGWSCRLDDTIPAPPVNQGLYKILIILMFCLCHLQGQQGPHGEAGPKVTPHLNVCYN